jgi:hypothetical protein
MNLDNRLRRLEEQAEQRQRGSDPLFELQVALDVAMMDASIPAPDGSPEREAQLERVATLQRALETGDLTGVDLTIYPPGFAGSPS